MFIEYLSSLVFLKVRLTYPRLLKKISMSKNFFNLAKNNFFAKFKCISKALVNFFQMGNQLIPYFYKNFYV